MVKDFFIFLKKTNKKQNNFGKSMNSQEIKVTIQNLLLLTNKKPKVVLLNNRGNKHFNSVTQF